MTQETTIEDRIAARIARIDAAKDQVVRNLIADLKASVRGAEAGLHTGNVALERRAVEVLERLIGVAPATVTLPSIDRRQSLAEWCRDWLDGEGFDVRGMTRLDVCQKVFDMKPPALFDHLRDQIGKQFPNPPIPDAAILHVTPQILLNDDLAEIWAASWRTPKSTRRRRLTRAEKIAASKAAGR
ncbi:hypothetical protein RCDORMIO_3 [Rhodobacter phage RcDormio]|nr:hypothetical protein RCDORMIO_3 [Rhodobacter phage RcDormio]QXN71200.1 hypothetical protein RCFRANCESLOUISE_3 [Rhodobacter phage RcFrancesLouise]UUV44142.1 hypothetical protein RCMAMADUCK_3 [Rhodobacter phage RcMamaDuck]